MKRGKIHINVGMEVKTPLMPNFLRTETGHAAIPIGSLDEAAFGRFADQYMEDLHKHWDRKRKQYLEAHK